MRNIYDGVSTNFRTGCLKQELQMVRPLGAAVLLFCESVY